jgi:hypothetical protein
LYLSERLSVIVPYLSILLSCYYYLLGMSSRRTKRGRSDYEVEAIVDQLIDDLAEGIFHCEHARALIEDFDCSSDINRKLLGDIKDTIIRQVNMACNLK